jgi:hypothetical protein
MTFGRSRSTGGTVVQELRVSTSVKVKFRAIVVLFVSSSAEKTS